MIRAVMGLLAGLALSAFQAGGALTGYKAECRTTVYEDLSVARHIEVALEQENREAIKYKKDFFRKNGYEVIEKTKDDRFILVASKVFQASGSRIEKFQDDLSKITVEKKGYTFLFAEEFSTKLLTDEVERSDLRNDMPAAKMLLADTRFDFFTSMPGKIDSISTGEFQKTTAHWSFDVEQIFKQATLSMRTVSAADRGDLQIWILMLIGILILLIGYLFRLKNKLRAA